MTCCFVRLCGFPPRSCPAPSRAPRSRPASRHLRAPPPSFPCRLRPRRAPAEAATRLAEVTGRRQEALTLGRALQAAPPAALRAWRHAGRGGTTAAPHRALLPAADLRPFHRDPGTGTGTPDVHAHLPAAVLRQQGYVASSPFRIFTRMCVLARRRGRSAGCVLLRVRPAGPGSAGGGAAGSSARRRGWATPSVGGAARAWARLTPAPRPAGLAPQAGCGPARRTPRMPERGGGLLRGWARPGWQCRGRQDCFQQKAPSVFSVLTVSLVRTNISLLLCLLVWGCGGWAK